MVSDYWSMILTFYSMIYGTYSWNRLASPQFKHFFKNRTFDTTEEVRYFENYYGYNIQIDLSFLLNLLIDESKMNLNIDRIQFFQAGMHRFHDNLKQTSSIINMKTHNVQTTI